MDLNKKLFVGIDASFSGTSVVIIDGNCNVIKQMLITTKHQDTQFDIEKRILYIASELNILLYYMNEYDLNLVCLEGLSYGSTGEAILQIAALNYFIRIFLFNNNIPYIVVSPTTLKKFVTGKGNVKKNLMLKEVYKKWGVDFNDDNLCDAYSLARFAEDSINKLIK